MKFRPDGPAIPDDLVALQEKGDTIFICGAGVSRMVGLPSFRGLVEAVYRELGEDWSQHAAENEVMRDGGSLANATGCCEASKGDWPPPICPSIAECADVSGPRFVAHCHFQNTPI